MVRKVSEYSHRVCVVCGLFFPPTSPLQKTCEGKCRDENRRAKERTRDRKSRPLQEKQCPLCSSLFSTRDSKRKYCGSVECSTRRVYTNNYNSDQRRRGTRTGYSQFHYEENRGVVLTYKKEKYRRDHAGRVVHDGPSTCRIDYAEVVGRFSAEGYKLLSCEADYISTHVKVLVECPSGHRWFIEPNSFKGGRRCPECAPVCGQSVPELEIINYFVGKYPSMVIIPSDRHAIGPLELDVYFPEKCLAVEYCGLHWHGELFSERKRNYHRAKMEKCQEHGIRLITVFEDEYLSNPHIVLSRIEHALGSVSISVFARKCSLRAIDSWQAAEFFEGAHLQGRSPTTVAFGLFYNDTLVQVLSLGHLSRSHAGKGGNFIELKRLASLPNLIVVGGASKLFAAAKKWSVENGYTHIKSYCDMRWANQLKPVYETLGFELVGETKYTPHYFRGQKRYRNQTLRKTPTERLTRKTEWELRQEQGFDRIWDCGHRSYVYNLLD